MPSDKKILFVCTEDWFFKSHFLTLHQIAAEMENTQSVLVCHNSKNGPDLAQLGVNTINIDFVRASNSPLSSFRLVRRLSRIFREQKPDLIHFISLKPVLLGGLACLFSSQTKKVFHVTGLGTLAEAKSWFGKIVKFFSFSLLGSFLKRPNSWLICENPDDLKILKRYSSDTKNNATIVGGAGVDPKYFSELKPNISPQLNIGFVGRMIWTKGVDVAIQAMDILDKTNSNAQLQLYGTPDFGNKKSFTSNDLDNWSQKPNITWHGESQDVREVWDQCDICIVPTREREGMPRAMLEAASCGRALIVTDVPGCRHFVHQGIEGIIVPPQNPQALANAIKSLEDDPDLRKEMGVAARKKLLDGYTEKHLKEAVKRIYKTLLK